MKKMLNLVSLKDKIILYTQAIQNFIFNHRILTSLFLIILLFTIHKRTFNDDIYTDTPALEKETIINNYEFYRIQTLTYRTLESMTLEEKIGQLFMLSIPYNYLDNDAKSLITEYYIGGIVLMGNNISSQQQISEFSIELQSTAKIELFIATDQEGGIIARIPWDDARFISQPHIGIVNREDFAYSVGEDHALALKNVNINMNLAPVLDISFIPESSMATRTLGASSAKVSVLGVQIIKAQNDNGIVTTAKHFPGIGRSSTDSHSELPKIDISKDQLLNEELKPFISAIENDVDFIMIGHALYPQIDSEFPSSLSNIIVTDILRNELNFEGIIITDDIHMGALDRYDDRAVNAFNAGCDMILIVESFENQLSYIEEIENAVNDGIISEERLNQSVKRILELKYRKVIH